MEKQPIDDLFARKLREAELPPSPDVFNRLQSRMASTKLPAAKRQAPIWWYGTAAASLLLIALFYFRSSSNVEQTALDQVVRQTKAKSPASLMPKPQPIQPVARVREMKMHRRIFVSPTQNGLDNRQKKMMASVTKSAMRREEAKSIAISRKNLVQKAVVPVPEITALTTKSESMAVITNRPELGQIAQLRLPVVSNPTDQQRVVVMTITEKADSPIGALQPTKVELTSQVQSRSLAGLFAKVKQLKNGDVLARATPVKRPSDSRSRLGRVFDGMRESLKNETTLE